MELQHVVPRAFGHTRAALPRRQQQPPPDCGAACRRSGLGGQLAALCPSPCPPTSLCVKPTHGRALSAGPCGPAAEPFRSRGTGASRRSPHSAAGAVRERERRRRVGGERGERGAGAWRGSAADTRYLPPWRRRRRVSACGAAVAGRGGHWARRSEARRGMRGVACGKRFLRFSPPAFVRCRRERGGKMEAIPRPCPRCPPALGCVLLRAGWGGTGQPRGTRGDECPEES